MSGVVPSFLTKPGCVPAKSPLRSTVPRAWSSFLLRSLLLWRFLLPGTCCFFLGYPFPEQCLPPPCHFLFFSFYAVLFLTPRLKKLNDFPPFSPFSFRWQFRGSLFTLSFFPFVPSSYSFFSLCLPISVSLAWFRSPAGARRMACFSFL